MSGRKRSGPAPVQYRIWQAMRVTHEFSTAELITITGAARGSVAAYASVLARAGIVRRTTLRAAHRLGQCARFVLVRNTGPLPPILRRNAAAGHAFAGVYDPNTGITWLAGGVQQPAAEQPQQAGEGAP